MRGAETRYRGWHAFRHSAGTRLVRQTGSLKYAAHHLGHSSIETTRVYAKWSD
ncbi:tyrosine-type recombinase/integrase [Deinococcus sp. QL22]|uniref:tyrosine-type recombinase/integrase n=1 Tax=Deinococcus sp. QL22 TaxID=2939437 RepID=UPI0020174092|nr:tyrosine-type recombinase/integrase [Deinococcus sp. QL22]UQN09002.1 tyrosine-type recombinase/integrase [Deinococcus sp. QL22]